MADISENTPPFKRDKDAVLALIDEVVDFVKRHDGKPLSLRYRLALETLVSRAQEIGVPYLTMESEPDYASYGPRLDILNTGTLGKDDFTVFARESWLRAIDEMRLSVEAWPSPGPAASKGDDTSSTNKKAKRSTERGEGRTKLIAALTKHHQYADGGCLNLERIGNNELAKAAGVSASTASTFFTIEFEGYAKYRAICRDAGRLVDSLKALNGEFSPHELYGRRPPDEDDRDDEGDE